MNRLKLKRKCELWVSNNRVLHQSTKKEPGRNRNFDTEETKLLITLWGDPRIQKTLITSHRKHLVIGKLAEKMREYGYNRSAEEINTRIKNLKCIYNRLKKDQDIGVNSSCNWKHFTAMDEIMTRAIFSAHPNEVPKPSLKYQLEMERNEREERNNLIESDASSVLNEMEHFDESDNGLKDQTNDNDDAHMQCNQEDVEFFGDDSGCTMKIKQEEDLDEFGETPLIIPKEEPVDEYEKYPSTGKEIKQSSECLTPRLLNTLTIPSNCGKLVNGNSCNTVQTSPSQAVNKGMTQSILIANKSNTMPSTGKISLVPANFLLQPNSGQPQQIQIRQQPQQRIICTQPNGQTNAGIVTSAGAGRMKVLLVNTFQNGKTTTSAVAANPNIITTANIHKTSIPDPGVSKAPAEPSKPGEEPTTSKDPGLEMLFNRLIHTQNENNEIQRQRLEVERQRLEFEKSMADKLLAAITSLAQVQRTDNAKNGNTVKDKAYPSDLNDEHNGFQLLTPKIEKDD